jgi:FKBP-type peptidyl-prolyl cis-trans isomerase SlpA
MLEVSPGTLVHLNFAIRLEDGSLIDSNLDNDPVKFEVGDGSLLFGFEKQLFGMKAGEAAVFPVDAEDGFGVHNPDNVQKIKADQFEDVEPEIGMIMGFSDPAQGEVPGVVCEIGDEYISVDFNHPLAGRKLEFDVKIHSVEPAQSH